VLVHSSDVALARPAGSRASPTLSTPSRPPRPPWPATGPACPNSATAASKPYATCEWPAAAPSTSAPTPNARSKTLIVTAPDELRAQLRGLTVKQPIVTCVNLRPDKADAANPATATKIALRSLAHRHQQLSTEIAGLDELLEPLVAAINPDLLAVRCRHRYRRPAARHRRRNHQRLACETAFARLCGVAPIPASSGKTTRHRLNRGGDRALNCAIHTIALTRIRSCPRTRAYIQRRTAEGKTPREIRRCLKRYLARELYQLITANDLQLPLDIHRSIRA
jgi:transposase